MSLQLVSNSGILLIHKPRGMNSTEVSSRLKRIFRGRGEKLHIGHLGTLDPLAEGLLPLMLGTATRLCEHLLRLPKTYLFDMQLGFATDTLDLGGKICERRPISAFTLHDVEQAIAILKAQKTQRPPLYSAVKVGGERLYSLAREGKSDAIDIDAIKRPMNIYDLKLIDATSETLNLTVTCSKGTYVRVLAEDLADNLGNLMTVTRIVRTSCGGFSLDNAYSIESIESALAAGEDLEKYLVPLAKISLDLAKFQCPDDGVMRRLTFGQMVKAPRLAEVKDQEEILLLDPAGSPFALGKLFRNDHYDLVKFQRRLV